MNPNKIINLNKIALNKYAENIFVVYKYIECGVCKKVCDKITELGYKCERKVRDEISENDFKKDKLVIVVGGDGTTLKVCQLIHNDSIVFSINSHPKTTEGFLTRASLDNFKNKFNDLFGGKVRLVRLPRLQARINRSILPKLALNEVSISAHKPYLTFMHELEGRLERSSGVLVTTPIGSTGWAKSAGGDVMPLHSRKSQFVIREPYNGRIYKVKKRKGLVDSLKIKARTDGIVVFDSCQEEYEFSRGDLIEVCESDSHIIFPDFG